MGQHKSAGNTVCTTHCTRAPRTRVSSTSITYKTEKASVVSPARGRACSTALRTWRAAGSHNRDASAQIALAGLQQKQGVFQVCALFHSIITFTANSAASRCQRRGTTSVTQLVQLQVTGKLVIRRAALIHTSPPPRCTPSIHTP